MCVCVCACVCACVCVRVRVCACFRKAIANLNQLLFAASGTINLYLPTYLPSYSLFSIVYRAHTSNFSQKNMSEIGGRDFEVVLYR